MFIDSKGKLFGKVSIIDLAVILLIVLLAVGIGMRFFVSNGKDSSLIMQNGVIEYKVEIKAVKKGAIDSLLKKGDVFSSKDNSKLGVITNVEFKEATDEKTKMDGNVVAATIPERFDAIVTVKEEGKIAIKDDRKVPYNGQNTEIHVGSAFKLTTKWIVCDSKIIDAEVK